MRVSLIPKLRQGFRFKPRGGGRLQSIGLLVGSVEAMESIRHSDAELARWWRCSRRVGSGHEEVLTCQVADVVKVQRIEWVNQDLLVVRINVGGDPDIKGVQVRDRTLTTLSSCWRLWVCTPKVSINGARYISVHDLVHRGDADQSKCTGRPNLLAGIVHELKGSSISILWLFDVGVNDVDGGDTALFIDSALVHHSWQEEWLLCWHSKPVAIVVDRSVLGKRYNRGRNTGGEVLPWDVQDTCAFKIFSMTPPWGTHWTMVMFDHN